MELRRLNLTQWEDALPQSSFNPFHTPGALSVIDEFAAGDLQLYGGFKGEQAVGLFPAFVNGRTIGRTVVSPPPALAIPRLGPILVPNSPKQRKRERVNRKFTDVILDALDVDSRRTLFRVICPTTYTDPRPYLWNDFEVKPEFTYRIDVNSASTDDLLMSFSKSLRKEIREGMDYGLSVDIEGVDAARVIYDSLDAIYESQDREFSPPWPYVQDMVKAMGDRCRIYVLRDPSGKFLNGMITLYSNNSVYSWLGGMRGEYEEISTNSLVKWGMLRDLVEDPPFESVRYWDMVGANTAHLCRYKSAFGGAIVPYYRIETAGKSMDLAKQAYQLIRS